MGNTHSVFVTHGASNHSDTERAAFDYYATDPKAMELLLEKESFDSNVWEPAVGAGHLAQVLTAHGYEVTASDIVDRGYPNTYIFDFLNQDCEPFNGDIVTNPPYKYAVQFVERALQLVNNGRKVAMFLKLQFLEGKSRRKLFDFAPPKTIYVASGRLNCAPNGDFTRAGSALAYAWFVWEKGFTGKPTIEWIN